MHDLAEVALVLGGIGAGGQLAFHGGLVERGDIRHQRLEVSPNLFHGRVDLVLGIRRHPFLTQVALGVTLQATDDTLETIREAIHGPSQVTDLIGAVHLQSRTQVALGHLLHHLHALFKGVRDGLGEDPAHDDGEEHGDAHDEVHLAAGPVGHDRVVIGCLLGQPQLRIIKRAQCSRHFVANL